MLSRVPVSGLSPSPAESVTASPSPRLSTSTLLDPSLLPSGPGGPRSRSEQVVGTSHGGVGSPAVMMAEVKGPTAVNSGPPPAPSMKPLSKMLLVGGVIAVIVISSGSLLALDIAGLLGPTTTIEVITDPSATVTDITAAPPKGPPETPGTTAGAGTLGSASTLSPYSSNRDPGPGGSYAADLVAPGHRFIPGLVEVTPVPLATGESRSPTVPPPVPSTATTAMGVASPGPTRESSAPTPRETVSVPATPPSPGGDGATSRTDGTTPPIGPARTPVSPVAIEATRGVGASPATPSPISTPASLSTTAAPEPAPRITEPKAVTTKASAPARATTTATGMVMPSPRGTPGGTPHATTSRTTSPPSPTRTTDPATAVPTSVTHTPTVASNTTTPATSTPSPTVPDIPDPATPSPAPATTTASPPTMTGEATDEGPTPGWWSGTVDIPRDALTELTREW